MKIDNNYYCDKCESLIPSPINPDRALELHLDGGYGMFIDLEQIYLLFCHDCAVEFFRSIPMLSADKINGLHSVSFKSKDFPLCCEYSWMLSENKTLEDRTVLGTKEHFDDRRKS